MGTINISMLGKIIYSESENIIPKIESDDKHTIIKTFACKTNDEFDLFYINQSIEKIKFKIKELKINPIIFFVTIISIYHSKYTNETISFFIPLIKNKSYK